MNAKIAVPSDDKLTICPHFGRTKGFILYDTEDGAIIGRNYIINGFTGHAKGNGENHRHGEPHNHKGNHNHDHSTIINALNTCDTVIANGMGQRMVNDFANNGKKVILTDISIADDAVNQYLKGNLITNPALGCCHHK